MAYTKTQWVNNQEPSISAENLNKMEQGIYDAQFPDEGDEGQVLTKTASGQAWGTLSATNVETSSDVAIKSASGNPVTIADALQGKALGANVTLEPIQDLHGYDHPWAGGAGKNKLKVNTTSVTRGGITFTVNDDGSVKIEGTTNSSNVFINMNYVANTLGIPVGTWKIGLLSDDPRISIRGYVTANSVETRAEAFGMDFETVTVPNDATQSHVRVQISITGITINTTVYPMILSGDETDTSWAPYSNICPITGRTQVDVTRTGKNLFAEPILGSYINDDGTISTPGNSNWRSDVIPLDGQQISATATIYERRTYTGSVSYIFFDENMQMLGKANFFVVSNITSFPSSKTITIPSTAKYMYFRGYMSGGAASIKTEKVQIEFGSTSTEYEPYTGQSVTVQLGQTVYGGTLDVTTGLLTVDRASVDLGSLNWLVHGTYASTFYADVSGKQPRSTKFISSAYANGGLFSSYANLENGTMYASTSDALPRIAVKNTTYTTASDFKTAMSGQTVVYELATPQTIQLSPAQINLLTGTNIISTNADDLSVMYYATGKGDVEGSLSFLLDKSARNETSINSLAGSLAMVETSPATTNHAVGDLIVYNNQLYEVTVAIATGETLKVGTNISATTVGDELSSLNNGLSNIGTYNDGTAESASVESGSFATVTTVAIPATGIYLVTGDISFGTDTNGSRILILSEVETSTNDVNNSVAATGRATLSKTRIMSLSAGNTIYLRAFQNSGSAMTVRGRIRTVRIR